MILIIDSNNLLGHPASHITHSMKRDLSARLARYTKHVPHTLIVVFDGGRDYETIIATTRLSIIHAGPDQTADTVIESLIEKSQSDQIVVVTKDRKIRSYAAKMGVATITPVQFLERVTAREMGTHPERHIAPHTSIRQYHSPDPTIDDLMRNAALMHGVTKKTESESELRERPSHRPSSQERTLLALLEKL